MFIFQSTNMDEQIPVKAVDPLSDKPTSMNCIIAETKTVEQKLINNLRSSSMNRRKAEGQLFVKYFSVIKSATKKYHIGEDEAFNAYSDTVLAVINAIRSNCFEGNCSLSTYLYAIFYRKCVDIVRRKAAQKNIIHKTLPISMAEMVLSDSSKPVLETLIMKFEFNTLVKRLDQFSVTSKRLMLLHAEGYVDKEIAVLLQFKTADVVRTSRHRCIKRLNPGFSKSAAEI